MEHPDNAVDKAVESLEHEPEEVRRDAALELLRSLDDLHLAQALSVFRDDYENALFTWRTDDERRNDALDTLRAARNALKRYSQNHGGFDQFELEVADVLRRFSALSESPQVR